MVNTDRQQHTQSYCRLFEESNVRMCVQKKAQTGCCSYFGRNRVTYSYITKMHVQSGQDQQKHDRPWKTAM